MRTSPRRRKLISQARCCRAGRDREQGSSSAGMWGNATAVPVPHPSPAERRQQRFPPLPTSCPPLAPSRMVLLLACTGCRIPSGSETDFTNSLGPAINPCKKNQEIIFCLTSKLSGASWEATQVREGLRGKEGGQQVCPLP